MLTFSYTSGTTGMPKGVKLSHRNYAANVGAFDKFDSDFNLTQEDMYISFLPLAHCFERFMMFLCMTKKIRIGFYQGDVLKLKDDLQEFKPTLMICVPRLLNRFYDLIQAGIA